jgi:hypothetical protein
VSDSVAEGIFHCLEELLKKCCLISVNRMVVILKKLTYGALSPSEASEEFLRGILLCFRALFLNLNSCSDASCSCKQILGLPILLDNVYNNRLHKNIGAVGETSEFQEDSVYSLCTEVDTDTLGNFQGAYEPSPISVLYSTFSEDISAISECGGSGVYDSSKTNDEGLELNVSIDDDYRNESVGNFEELIDQNLDIWHDAAASVSDALRHYCYQNLSTTSEAAEENLYHSHLTTSMCLHNQFL